MHRTTSLSSFSPGLCVHLMSSACLQIEAPHQIKSNSPHCLCRWKANLSSNWYVFALLTPCLSTIPSCCRFHPSPSDLWHGYRLHLSLLEHRVRRERSLHAVRQRGLQAPVCQHRHCSEVVCLPPVHHHVAVLEKELQEVHQEQRGLPHAHRTLCLQCDPGQFRQGDHAESRHQDKVHLQPGGRRDVRQPGVGFIVAGGADSSPSEDGLIRNVRQTGETDAKLRFISIRHLLTIPLFTKTSIRARMLN